MALIVEDGSGKPDSESYISVINADTYHSNRGNAAWTALATPAKEQALRKATDYLTQMYRLKWKGYRTDNIQALDWPRQNVSIVENGFVLIIEQDEIPDELKNACAELALRASSEDLNPDTEQETIGESLGPLSISYAPGAKQSKEFSAVEMMLQPLLKNNGSGIQIERA